jgi:asparagine synthase (glutamine-hydrolysing)
MCGIAGLVDFSGGPIDPALLEAMSAAVRHRGPDGERRTIDGVGGVSIGLAHRRLAIIDLSEAAAQPMRNDACVDAGRAAPLTIVFNGEIYNYPALREELLDRGHALTTRSDTEVILHLFEEEGPQCVRRLRGMFALAIWDAAKRRLVCARDRLGKKPLYYRHDGTRFWFASTGQAILRDPRVPDDLQPRAVQAYLALGYVPGALSAHAALRRLPPAHVLVADAQGVRLERYWELPYEPKQRLSDGDAASMLRTLIEDSVRMRLISDVPLGAFLSGGLDSSIVAASMARSAPRRIKTFSIGFEDAAYNELPQARLVAERYDTDHHELVVRPDAVSLIPEIVAHYGEPFADSSALPTYMLAGLVRSEITVALNGDGGDEAFAGYKRHWANAMALRYVSAPLPLRRALEHGVRTLVRAGSARTLAYDVQRFMTGTSRPLAERYAAWFGFFDESAFTPEFIQATAGDSAVASLREAFDLTSGLDPIDAALSVDVQTYLPDDLLVKVDTASMAHGLEPRSPLLDHVLLEFAATLPVSMKIRGRQGKQLLRRVARDLVPEKILNGPKRGFGVPLDRWFRAGLGQLARDTVADPESPVSDYIKPAVVQRLLAEHQSGRFSHGQRLWALLMLDSWFRERARGGTDVEASA